MTTVDEDADAERGLDEVQIDFYGIKARAKPRSGEQPDPETWREVAQSIHKELKRSCAGLFVLLTTAISSTTNLLRGIGNLPAAAARRIENAHDIGDARENQRQLHLASEVLNPRGASEALAEINRILTSKQVEGLTTRIYSDGERLVICVLKPADRRLAESLARRALKAAEDSAETVAGTEDNTGKTTS